MFYLNKANTDLYDYLKDPNSFDVSDEVYEKRQELGFKDNYNDKANAVSFLLKLEIKDEIIKTISEEEAAKICDLKLKLIKTINKRKKEDIERLKKFITPEPKSFTSVIKIIKSFITENLNKLPFDVNLFYEIFCNKSVDKEELILQIKESIENNFLFFTKQDIDNFEKELEPIYRKENGPDFFNFLLEVKDVFFINQLFCLMIKGCISALSVNQNDLDSFVEFDNEITILTRACRKFNFVFFSRATSEDFWKYCFYCYFKEKDEKNKCFEGKMIDCRYKCINDYFIYDLFYEFLFKEDYSIDTDVLYMEFQNNQDLLFIFNLFIFLLNKKTVDDFIISIVTLPIEERVFSVEDLLDFFSPNFVCNVINNFFKEKFVNGDFLNDEKTNTDKNLYIEIYNFYFNFLRKECDCTDYINNLIKLYNKNKKNDFIICDIYDLYLEINKTNNSEIEQFIEQTSKDLIFSLKEKLNNNSKINHSIITRSIRCMLSKCLYWDLFRGIINALLCSPYDLLLSFSKNKIQISATKLRPDSSKLWLYLFDVVRYIENDSKEKLDNFINNFSLYLANKLKPTTNTKDKCNNDSIDFSKHSQIVREYYDTTLKEPNPEMRLGYVKAIHCLNVNPKTNNGGEITGILKQVSENDKWNVVKEEAKKCLKELKRNNDTTKSSIKRKIFYALFELQKGCFFSVKTDEIEFDDKQHSRECSFQVRE